ncbi:ATP-binding protein [Aquincola sp. MAHUQ-54]|uniref:histidine kinase n=1 Tax=Aquincola agrisoli TaxID=3119538 RepID=A0AAW9QRB9_9BURK
MTSLRSRIMRAAGGTIVLCWAIALGALGAYFAQSQSSIADNELRTMAIKILMAIPQKEDWSWRDVRPRLQLRADAQGNEEQLAFQVWIDKSSLAVRTPGAPGTPLRADFAEGFASTVVDGQRWRVVSVSDRAGRIYVQVGNLHSAIDAELRHNALVALGVATVVLMLVGAFMWCVVHKALKPVADLEAALHRRRRLDLTPLPAQALPTELRPLVGAFNHVLQQLDEAVEGERRFIGDAAHELRTPLAALQAQAQVAVRASTPAEKDAALGKLLAVAERSTRLSEQLLDLARLNADAHAPRRSAAELNELAVHVSREFDMQAHQQRRRLVLALQPCTIECDVDEVGILLRNLVDNALRYTAPGGSVRVACGPCDTAAGPRACLEVADDGPGVPASEREAIFQRFHRVAGSTVRGSGIGLSLVAGIAQLHGAAIETGPGLEGRGFSVRVLFPPAGPA